MGRQSASLTQPHTPSDAWHAGATSLVQRVSFVAEHSVQLPLAWHAGLAGSGQLSTIPDPLSPRHGTHRPKERLQTGVSGVAAQSAEVIHEAATAGRAATETATIAEATSQRFNAVPSSDRAVSLRAGPSPTTPYLERIGNVRRYANPLGRYIRRGMATPDSGDAYLVLSALGPDRPGLVAEVTSFLTDRGGNIEDSRMAVFGAEFGIFVLVSGTPEEVAKIAEDARALEEKTSLTVLTRPTKSPSEHRHAPTVPCIVTAEALDHEGFLRSVARALARTGANIVSLETSAYNAPVTGSPLFRLEAQVDLPREVTIAKVREAMSELAERQNIDIEVRSLVRRP
jgi:glycine cleavage system transcriptional repressor